MKMLKFIGLIRVLQMTWDNICYVTWFSFLANKISIDPLSLS